MGVSEPVVIVEDHDGADHAARHHDHDAREVRPDQRRLTARRLGIDSALKNNYRWKIDMDKDEQIDIPEKLENGPVL